MDDLIERQRRDTQTWKIAISYMMDKYLTNNEIEFLTRALVRATMALRAPACKVCCLYLHLFDL